MKNIYINLLLIISLGFSYGQIDRSNPPVSGPMPSIELGTPIEFQLKNGLRVLMVENKKLPRVTANLLIDNPPFLGSDKNGIYSMTSSILGKGTESISKDVFVEKIDFMGASLSINAGGAFASSISRFFPTVLEMMADGALNPLFSQEEFEKEKAKTIEGIKSNAKSVVQIARRVENVLAFGKDHPNGKYITEESVNNISLDDVKSFYRENYTPNNAYLVIIGDFNPKEVQKSVKNLFSKWKKTKNVSSKKWTDAKESKNLTLNFVDVPNAIQSEVVFQNIVDLNIKDPDYFPVLVANKILGGGPENRLEQQIREVKGYTYVARSSIGSSKYTKSRFRAFTQTRFQVTDSAVVELLNEIKKIRTLNVTSKELSDVKAKYVGNFVLASESPSTIANYALNIKTQGLDKDFYKNYLKNIDNVTIDDIKRVANKYFKLDNGQIIVTGKASELLEKIDNVNFDGKIIPVSYFDNYGNKVEKPKNQKFHLILPLILY
jgi:zinc protease